MRPLLRSLLAVLALTAVLPAPSMAADAPAGVAPVGIVSRVQNQAEAVRAGEQLALTPSDPVARMDRLTTGERSMLQVSLLDEGTLLLGANGALVLDDLILKNEEESVLRLAVDGPFRLISGALNHAAGTEIVTPVATIGIRGTDVWGGVIDGAWSVFLIEGEVSVTTAAGQVILDTPGTGTTIPAADQPPTAPVDWAQDKIQRAVATVTFQ